MKNVTVASFETRPPAEQLVERLEAAGVPADIFDERALQRFWFLSRPHAAFRLNVAKEHVEATDRLFAEWHASEGALHEAFRCPQCRSLRVDYPQMTRKFVLPTLVAHLLSLLGFMRHEFYCQECQFTWRLPSKLGWRSVPAKQAELPKGFRPKVV